MMDRWSTCQCSSAEGKKIISQQEAPDFLLSHGQYFQLPALFRAQAKLTSLQPKKLCHITAITKTQSNAHYLQMSVGEK